MLKVEKQSYTLPLFSDPRLFEELFCSSFKWTSSAVSVLNQLTNTRNYTVKELLDFGNPKNIENFNDLRLIPGSEAFGKGRGGVAYRYRLCDTTNETKVPS